MGNEWVVTVEATWSSTHTFTAEDLADMGVAVGEVIDALPNIPEGLLEAVTSNVASLTDWDVHLNMQKGPDHE